jgi:hypothetical protein
VIKQAVAVHEALSFHPRVEDAYWPLWLFGYEIDVEIARAKLLEEIALAREVLVKVQNGLTCGEGAHARRTRESVGTRHRSDYEGRYPRLVQALRLQGRIRMNAAVRVHETKPDVDTSELSRKGEAADEGDLLRRARGARVADAGGVVEGGVLDYGTAWPNPGCHGATAWKPNHSANVWPASFVPDD